jgi:hypothetical protein
MRKVLIGAFALLGLVISLTIPFIQVQETQAVSLEKPKYVYGRDVEVKIMVNGYPLEEYFARGKRYVEALEGAEYEIRITNRLADRVAVALSVDGLNTIDARRLSAWDSSKWIVGPYQTITINGWQMSSSRARKFYFTTEQDSYGAKLGRTSDLGIISAVFFKEQKPISVITPRREHEDYKENQRAKKRQPSPGSSSTTENERSREQSMADDAGEDYAATGIGRSIDNDVRWVNLNLNPHPIAQTSLRYEYRSTLVKLGIIPKPYPTSDPLERRERARGFENQSYCPEP